MNPSVTPGVVDINPSKALPGYIPFFVVNFQFNKRNYSFKVHFLCLKQPLAQNFPETNNSLSFVRFFC
jgi:hypothetical protein